jgi:enamine deaminase RidA (YjgF/YER057c/UK114 family)
VRSGYLQSARPASTLVVVRALARPEWLFEVEAVAWRP